MPIVTDSILSGLRTGFNAAYKRGAGRAPGHWQKVATRISSTSASNTYGWLGQFPKLSEWVGDRAVKDMKEHGYVVTNKLYEGTVGVKRTDIEDDNLGIYAPMFEEMGYAAATHPDELVFGLLGKGFSTNCYDGQFFFDKDHPVAVNVDGTGGNATVSNLIDAAESPESKTPWYLLDVSRTLKPLIFQERTSPELQAITDGKNDTVFMKDQYLYGVRYRRQFREGPGHAAILPGRRRPPPGPGNRRQGGHPAGGAAHPVRRRPQTHCRGAGQRRREQPLVRCGHHRQRALADARRGGRVKEVPHGRACESQKAPGPALPLRHDL